MENILIIDTRSLFEVPEPELSEEHRDRIRAYMQELYEYLCIQRGCTHTEALYVLDEAIKQRLKQLVN